VQAHDSPFAESPDRQARISVTSSFPVGGTSIEELPPVDSAKGDPRDYVVPFCDEFLDSTAEILERVMQQRHDVRDAVAAGLLPGLTSLLTESSAAPGVRYFSPAKSHG